MLWVREGDCGERERGESRGETFSGETSEVMRYKLRGRIKIRIRGKRENLEKLGKRKGEREATIRAEVKGERE